MVKNVGLGIYHDSSPDLFINIIFRLLFSGIPLL